MSAGHGGQVVVSPTTAALVDLTLTELGEHRLKDIAEAVPLYQLGEGSFPPLKTISNTNLPRPASSFLGRETELEEVVSKLDGGARLLTLTGPGGRARPASLSKQPPRSSVLTMQASSGSDSRH